MALPAGWLKRGFPWLVCAVLVGPAGAAPVPTHALAQAVGRVDTDPRGAEAELDHLLAQALEPAQRVDVLVAKGRAQVSLGRLGEAAATAAEAVRVVAPLQDEARWLDVENLRCGVMTFQGEYQQALKPAQEALKRAQARGLKPQAARLANLLGGIYNFTAQIPPAIDHYLLALRLAEELREDRMRLQILHNLGNLYLVSNDADKALECLNQALPLARLAASPELVAGLLVTRASALEQRGAVQEELADLEEALGLARQAGLRRVEAAALGNLADVHLSLGHHGKALSLAEASLAICEETRDVNQVLTLRVTRAQALSHLGRASEAIAIMRAALLEFRSQGHQLEAIQVERILSETLAAAGRHREALEVFRAYKASSDALLQKENQLAVARFREQYEAEKRERQIAALTAENQVQTAELKRKRIERFLAIGGGISLAAIVALLALRHRSARRTNAQLQALNERLEDLSLTDPLTGLRNRRYFLSRIEEEAAHARRQALSGEPGRLGVMLLDIDHFKPLNDREGHAVGDQILAALAERFWATLRKTDIVIRWGGEEFLVLSRDTTEEGLQELAQRLLEVVRQQPFPVGERGLQVTCSIGCCTYPMVDDLDWEQTVHLADWALYRAKALGRDRAVSLRAGRALRAGLGLETVADPERALERGILEEA